MYALNYTNRLVEGKRDGPGLLCTVFGGVLFDGIWKENVLIESKQGHHFSFIKTFHNQLSYP